MSHSQRLGLEELYLGGVTPETEFLTPVFTCLSQIHNQISININLDALNSNH